MNFLLNIMGYYRDLSRTVFPESSGIYFVYRGIYVPHLKTVTLTQLLYIGETGNLHERHNDHGRRNDFLNSLEDGEELFYSYALVDNFSDRQRRIAEAALIYELCPPLNEEHTTSFGYEETTINILGDRHAYIPSQIKAPSY